MADTKTVTLHDGREFTVRRLRWKTYKRLVKHFGEKADAGELGRFLADVSERDTVTLDAKLGMSALVAALEDSFDLALTVANESIESEGLGDDPDAGDVQRVLLAVYELNDWQQLAELAKNLLGPVMSRLRPLLEKAQSAIRTDSSPASPK